MRRDDITKASEKQGLESQFYYGTVVEYDMGNYESRYIKGNMANTPVLRGASLDGDQFKGFTPEEKTVIQEGPPLRHFEVDNLVYEDRVAEMRTLYPDYPWGPNSVTGVNFCPYLVEPDDRVSVQDVLEFAEAMTELRRIFSKVTPVGAMSELGRGTLDKEKYGIWLACLKECCKQKVDLANTIHAIYGFTFEEIMKKNLDLAFLLHGLDITRSNLLIPRETLPVRQAQFKERHGLE